MTSTRRLGSRRGRTLPGGERARAWEDLGDGHVRVRAAPGSDVAGLHSPEARGGCAGERPAGRSMKTVRDKYGPTYGIGASVVSNWDNVRVPGHGHVRGGEGSFGVDRMQEVVEDWMRHGITEDELRVQQSMRCGGCA